MKEKKLLEEEMEKNKERIEELKNSPCIKDIEQTTK